MAFAFNGFGTKYYGTRLRPDGALVTTKWIVLFFVPIIPLGTVRIIEGDLGQNNPLPTGMSLSSAKTTNEPLDLRMVAWTYACEVGLLLFFIFVLPVLNGLLEHWKL
jgi:hypothetical protein